MANIFDTIHNKITGFHFPKNPKQVAMKNAINLLKGNTNIISLETGRIRNPAWRNSDGNSTYFITAAQKIHTLYSLDNDSENFSGYSGSQAYCEQYLSTQQLNKVIFINGNSTETIKNIPLSIKFDFVLLDSANDPELIFNEYLAIAPYLNPIKAIVMVDDVTLPGKKGDTIMPFFKSKGIKTIFYDAKPADCILAIIENNFTGIAS